MNSALHALLENAWIKQDSIPKTGSLIFYNGAWLSENIHPDQQCQCKIQKEENKITLFFNQGNSQTFFLFFMITFSFSYASCFKKVTSFILSLKSISNKKEQINLIK